MTTKPEKVEPRLSRTSLLALMMFMLVPIVALFEVWPLSSGLTSGLTLLFVGIFLGTTVGTKRDRILQYNAGVYFFAAIVGGLAISVLGGSYALDATWRWYLIALIACLFTLVAASELKACNPKRFHNVLSRYLWLGCLAYGILSILKYYGFLSLVIPNVEPSGGRLTGLWSQSNLTTTMCWLGVLAGSVSLSDRQRKLWYVSLLVFGWTLACAASRMSWLMTAGLFLLIFVSRLPRFRTAEAEASGRSLFKGVILVFILLFLVPPINQLIRDALVSIEVLEQGKAVSLAERDAFQENARLTELSKVMDSVRDFSWKEWLVGVGPGNYSDFSYRADMSIPPEGLVAGTWSHSHNVFTMVFVEFGLVGLLILIALVASIAIVALKPAMDLSRFFSIGGIGILFIHSNLEFPLWYLWFLSLFCLFLTNLFEVRQYRGDSKWLKPGIGIAGLIMIGALLINTGSQYIQIVQVAMDSRRDRDDFQTLAILANDSLMGPYAILRKYRDFAPESSSIEWQLREAKRMKAWQPTDLVVLREFSLLVLKQDLQEACIVAEKVAYRYPHSAPIMLDHALIAGSLSPSEITRILNCIEEGLAPRGETVVSMQQKNKSKLAN
ncbi:PglL family O-oligosaccharyltransferase [Marinobacter salsuginis]|nr:O-antigen ligase family protein [Marinobacter salsuginis]